MMPHWTKDFGLEMCYKWQQAADFLYFLNSEKYENTRLHEQANTWVSVCLSVQHINVLACISRQHTFHGTLLFDDKHFLCLVYIHVIHKLKFDTCLNEYSVNNNNM